MDNLTTCEGYRNYLVSVVEGEEPQLSDRPYTAEELEGTTLHANVFRVDDDMIQAVNVYLELVAELKAAHPDAECKIEARFDLTFVRPNMFGTGDFMLYDWVLRKLIIVDYKHGKGVPVEVEDNPQLKYYGLGGAHEVDYEVDSVDLIVVQPRCPHEDGPVRTYSLTIAELRKFEKELAEGYDRAEEPDSMLSPGEHCKFCPALGVPGLCTASEEKVMEVARNDFAMMPIENDEIPMPRTALEMQKALMWIPLVDAWCKKVKGHAEAIALQGETVPGYKLVTKKTNRAWNDFQSPEEIVTELGEKFGIESDAMFEKPKMLTPAKVEKLLTAKQKRELAATGLIIKPHGALTLVHESDAREAQVPLLQAAEDFKNLPEADEDKE